MAYENIRFPLPHMAARDGNFYFLDYTNRIFYQKTAGGGLVFQYPVDIPVRFTSYAVGDVKCLHYDGYSFWSLQNLNDGTGILIRQWKLTNFICVLVNQFTKITNTYTTYNANTFAVEYYNTYLTSNFFDGSTYITLYEYTDSVVYAGSILGIGPNKYGLYEMVTVSGVSGSDVVLTTPLMHSFFVNDPVTITPSILLFNNFYFKDAAKGSIIMIDPYTGVDISVVGDVDYDNITASKFTRLTNILHSNSDIYTLAFVQNTNLKLRDMSDIYRYKAWVRVNDDFNLPNDSPPNVANWQISSGDPAIKDNTFFCSAIGVGHDSVKSKYLLLSDFDVQISGTLGDFTTFSGSMFKLINHYLGIETLAGSYYNLGFSYLENLDQITSVFTETFSASGINWNHLRGTTVYNNGYLQHTTDSSADITKTTFNWNYGGSLGILFKFKNHGTSSNNDQYHFSPISSSDTNNRITVYMKTYSSGDNYVQLYKRVSSTNTVLHTNTKYNYFTEVGNWFYVRLERTENSLFRFKIWKDGTSEPITWDWTGTHSDVISTGYILSDCIYTSGTGAGVDDIYIYKAFDTAAAQQSYVFSLWKNNNDLIKYTKVGDITTWDSSRSYNMGITRVGNDVSFKYQTMTSGIADSSWVSLANINLGNYDSYIYLGLESISITVSGSYFDNLNFSDTTFIRYPTAATPYYGTMNIENIQTNQSTVIPIYAIDIEDDNLYRLQLAGTYYGTNNTWATYNYQISPIRPFVDFITVDASTNILPATGRNTAIIRSISLDQYGQGVINRPVTFTDDDPIGFITTKEVYTDLFYNTGRADTGYTSGTAFRLVEIEATITHVDY